MQDQYINIDVQIFHPYLQFLYFKERSSTHI